MKRGSLVVLGVVALCLVAASAMPVFGKSTTKSNAAPLFKQEAGDEISDPAYYKLANAAAKGDVLSIRRFMRLRFDGAATDDHASDLTRLLKRVGDRKFATALSAERYSVRNDVWELL